MKNIFPLIILVFAVRLIQAQNSPSIGAYTVNPPAPTSQNTVSIITKVTTANSGSRISSFYVVNHSQKKIDLGACYFEGMMTALKTYVDTFNVGQLQPGTYTVNFSAWESSSTSSCVATRSNSIGFTLLVAGNAVSVPETAPEPNPVVFPNPVKDQLYFTNTAGFSELKIFDGLGTLVKVESLDKEINSLDLRWLKDGFYVLRFGNDQRTYCQRLVKTSTN